MVTGPSREDGDIATVLRTQASRYPARRFLVDAVTGMTLDYGGFLRRVDELASGLASQGIAAGDYVNLMLENSVDYLVVAYALRTLGAVEVAINVEARGDQLARMMRLAGAKASIVEASFLERLSDANCVGDELGRLIVRRGSDPATPGTAVRLDDLPSTPPPNWPPPPPNPLDPAMVIFTSGTTGPSKGCVLCHRSLIRSGEAVRDALELTNEDVVYSPYPLFHARASVLDVLGTLLAGGAVVLAPRFSASNFWSDCRAHGVTIFSIIGTVMQILWKQPAGSADREHPVRRTWGGPITIDPDRFRERFGVEVLPGDGVFGMSETGMLNMSSFDPETSGKIRPIYEVVIADDLDQPVAPGDVGEILVRPREPGVLFSGYLGMPAATVEATRNLWFHTGDLGRMDESGRMTFVGRKRDMVRTSGHNVSPWEVEQVIANHPAVLEAAVVGLPDTMGEEQVVAVIVPMPATDIDAEALSAYCKDHLASYKVPRRIAIVHELPKTQSGKVAKADLVQLLMRPSRAG